MLQYKKGLASAPTTHRAFFRVREVEMAYKNVQDEIQAVLNEMASEYADKVLSDKRDMMTVKEVADVLGTSERFVYNLIAKEHKLFAFKLGRKVVIPKESIRDYLTQNYV